MRRSSHAKRPLAEGLAAAAKKHKLAVRPDNEPGSGRCIMLVEDGRQFRIPVTGPKEYWAWDLIDDDTLRAIIRSRIREKGITTVTQLAKSKPFGARIERKAKERGILDDLLPKQEKKPRTQNPRPETETRKQDQLDTGKPDRRDQEEQWRIRRQVVEWMEDDEWWDRFLGKHNKSSE